MTKRCALCTANDLDQVQEKLAKDMWERRGAAHGRWEDAGPQWRAIFLDLAGTAMRSLGRPAA